MKLKIERGTQKKTRTKEAFSQVLKVAISKAATCPPVVSHSAEKLASVRSAMHVEAHRLVNRRDESHATHDESRTQRITEMIASEIGRGLSVDNGPTTHQDRALLATATPPSCDHVTKPLVPFSDKASPSQSSHSHVDSVMAMAEKIEWWVKQTRPALSLTLAGTQGGTVDIEKVGSKTVRIRLNRGGVLGPQALHQLQNELRAKGLSWVMEESGPGIGIKH